MDSHIFSVFQKMLAMDQPMWCGIALICGLIMVCGLSLKKKRLPPGPFAWPVVGNLFIGGEHPYQVFSQLAKQYGNIMSLFFGSVRVVIVSDADMARELFSVSDAKFSSRPVHDLMFTASKYMNFGDEDISMAISTYGPRVRELRQLCMSEMFTPQKLETKTSTRAEEVQRMVAKLAMGEGNPPIEIRPLVSEFSLRISCRTVFNKAFLHSESDSSLHPQTFRRLEMENSKPLAENNLADVIPLFRLVLGRLDVQGINARWKDVNMLKESCTSSVLAWYREHGHCGPGEESTIDFVETLLRLSQGGKLSVTAIKSLILVRSQMRIFPSQSVTLRSCVSNSWSSKGLPYLRNWLNTSVKYDYRECRLLLPISHIIHFVFQFTTKSHSTAEIER